MGNTINVQGSYIDVHDNENVYLSVDKAKVSMDKGDGSVVEEEKGGTAVPDVLASEEAQIYWERLQEAGFTDADHQLLSGVSRKQAMYIALTFAEKLNLTSKWKPFEQLWNKRNLAQEKWNMTETGIMPSRYEEIEELFEE